MNNFQKGDTVVVTSATSMYFGIEGDVQYVNGELVTVKFPDVFHPKTYKAKNLRMVKAVAQKVEKRPIIIFDYTDDYEQAKDTIRCVRDIMFYGCTIINIETSYDMIDHPEISERLQQHKYLCVWMPENPNGKYAILSQKVQTMYIG